MHARSAGAGLGAWREAWQARRDNPLPRLWQLAHARREQRHAWWRQSPGLVLLGIAISIIATYMLLLIIRQFLILHDSSLATQSYALGLLRAGTLILAYGAMVLGGGWLLSRLYGCAHLALSLLSKAPRKDFEDLSAELRASGISDEQVVLAPVLHAWRVLLPPLLVLGIANAAAYCVRMAWPLGAEMKQVAIPPYASTPVPWWEALAVALAFLALQLLAFYTGAAMLMLLLLLLGRSAGPLAPALGAGGQVVLQLALIILVSDYRFPLGSLVQNDPAWWTACLIGLALALAAWYALFEAAQRWRWLRQFLAHALLAYVLLLAGLFIWSSFDSPHFYSVSAVAVFFTSWQAASLCLLPAGLSSMPAIAVGITSDPYSLAEMGLVTVLLQATLCYSLARLARDAVRRCRGGAE